MGAIKHPLYMIATVQKVADERRRGQCISVKKVIQYFLFAFSILVVDGGLAISGVMFVRE